MKSVWRLLGILMVAAMVLASCAPAAAPAAPAAPAATEAAPAAPAATEAAPAATEAPTVATEAPKATEAAAPADADFPKTTEAGQELTDALAGKYKGKVVTMAGPFVDADAVVFENSMKPFEAATGIDIQYTGSKEFEASITISVEGGNAPDIVDFPQPGLLSSLVAKDKVVDLTKIINQDWMKKNYNQSWLDMATMSNSSAPIMAGVWNRTSVKSLVWYPKAAFDAAGYKVPTTWDEMLKLTDQIVADGDTPWCIGIESGAATGWPMTDWLEDTMLRTTSLENYDKWVKGELKFDSPEVRKALKYISDIWFKDANVYGGRKAIATTAFGDSPKAMFENPPKCWLHRQANFITTFFPEGSVAGKDYSFFYLPPIDPAYGKPVLVAGDIYAMFNDRPETRALIQYFTMGDSVKGWVQAGGAISPHKDSKLDWYTTDIAKGVAQILLDASSVRFDASDLMPAAVGQGVEWKSLSDYVTGAVDENTALKNIDAAWPK
jgi:alpha-glucoside transport system substrate-binding protein